MTGTEYSGISGRTRPFYIIADPVDHVRTPQAFNARMAAANLDAAMVAAQIARGDLEQFVNAARLIQNLGGMIVTIPHKEAVVQLCDELGDQARRVGSVNAIRKEGKRLIGENFDGIGFVSGLKAQGHEVQGTSALLLGSGGAAGAIAFALMDAGLGRLKIWNRTAARADALAARLNAAGYADVTSVEDQEAEGVDLIVNATPLGMSEGDPLPFPPERIGPQHIVAEVIMSPEKTRLLHCAENAGATIHLGKHMLDAQLDAMAEFIGAFQV